MNGQNFNGLPNGRMSIACLHCGWRADLKKLGWSKVVCSSCHKIIDHPIDGIKTSKVKNIKTNLMLSKLSRDLLYTISQLHDSSQSEALNMILKFAFDEYCAGGNQIQKNPKDLAHWKKHLIV